MMIEVKAVCSEAIERTVKRQGHVARIYLPKAYIGMKVTILVEPTVLNEKETTI